MAAATPVAAARPPAGFVLHPGRPFLNTSPSLTAVLPNSVMQLQRSNTVAMHMHTGGLFSWLRHQGIAACATAPISMPPQHAFIHCSRPAAARASAKDRTARLGWSTRLGSGMPVSGEVGACRLASCHANQAARNREHAQSLCEEQLAWLPESQRLGSIQTCGKHQMCHTSFITNANRGCPHSSPAIAARSYVEPSAATTGSCMGSWVMGHTTSSASWLVSSPQERCALRPVAMVQASPLPPATAWLGLLPAAAGRAAGGRWAPAGLAGAAGWDGVAAGVLGFDAAKACLLVPVLLAGRLAGSAGSSCRWRSSAATSSSSALPPSSLPLPWLPLPPPLLASLPASTCAAGVWSAVDGAAADGALRPGTAAG